MLDNRKNLEKNVIEKRLKDRKPHHSRCPLEIEIDLWSFLLYGWNKQDEWAISAYEMILDCLQPEIQNVEYQKYKSQFEMYDFVFVGKKKNAIEYCISKLDSENKLKLTGIILSNEKNRSKHRVILDEIFPEAALVARINSHKDMSKKMDALDSYLSKGWILRPEYVIPFIKMNKQQSELIRFFIQHELCKKNWLIYIFEKYCSSNADYAALCLKQKNFTTTFKEYFELTGETFASSVCKLLQNVCKVNHNEVQINRELLLNIIQSVFKKFPSCITSIDLESFSTSIMHSYCLTTEDMESDSHLHSSLSILQDALLPVVEHPEYQFLPSDAVVSCEFPYFKKFTTSRIDSLKPYPFYFALTNGNQELLKLFYLHEDTPDLAKQAVIRVLKKLGYQQAMSTISLALVFSVFQPLCITYMLLLNEKMIADIRNIILGKFINLQADDCLAAMMKYDEPPQLFKNKKISMPTLFQNKPVSHEWLLTRAIVKIRDYIFYDKASLKGGNRARSFLEMFGNNYLSTAFKMLALHTLLHENTIFGDKLQKRLEPALESYYSAIKDAAEEYASEHQQNLMTLKNNLIDFIHSGVNDNFFSDVREHELLKIIKSAFAEKCLVM